MKQTIERRSTGGFAVTLVTILCAIAFSAGTVFAAAINVQVSVGESVTVKATDVAKLAVADPAVADVLPLSETELSIIGKKAGVTTITIVHSEGRETEHYRVEVGLSAGVRTIHEALGSPTIKISEIGEAVILEGKVSDERQAERAVKIAAAYKANVVNLLEVTSPRQVRIRTRLVEVSTDATKKLGIEYFGQDGDVTYAFAFGGNGTDLTGPIHGFGTPPAAQLNQGVNTVSATLRLLAEKGAAKILSEPTLVTLSGKEASFLSGGEVPIVTILGDSQTTEFKEFGVRMKIKPVVDSENNIATHVTAEVSDVANIDARSGIPTFRTRRTETDVQVKDGQTIAIGGLLQNQLFRDATRKVPWLGDIPGLGLLFRSKDYQAGTSELLVFVTPEVVKDIAADTAAAAATPEMKQWHGKDADAQLLVEPKPKPEWQKPWDIDEMPLPKEEKNGDAKPADADATTAPAASEQSPTPAAPAVEPEKSAQP